MAISSHALHPNRKKVEKRPNLQILSKPRPWIKSLISAMILFLVIGSFVRVGFSALVVNKQQSLDKTINQISDANDENRALRFGIMDLESASRIKEIALGSPERIIDKENGIYGLGMMKAENVKWIRPSMPTPQNKWQDVVVANPSSGGNE
jgi:cell division protein FtsL